MDLATTYLGLSLRNPLVASASPLSQSADRVIELVEAGVSAVVLHSLFEEQIEHPTPDADVPHFFFNPAGPGAPRRYLDLVEECVESVDVPVIASINGTSRHGWTSFAHSMQDAGAAAVECNFYNVPQRMQGPGRDHVFWHERDTKRGRGSVAQETGVAACAMTLARSARASGTTR